MIKRVVIIIAIVLVIAIAVFFFSYNRTTYYNLDERYNLADSKVLGYGILDQQDSNSGNKLVEDSKILYDEYGKNGKLYFVFGDQKEVTIASYDEVILGKVGVVVGNSYNGFDVQDKKYLSKEVLPSKNKLTVQIGGKNYEFNLKSGETSYFIIYENGEK